MGPSLAFVMMLSTLIVSVSTALAEPRRAADRHCGDLARPDAQQVLKSTLGDLLSTYRPGASTMDLLHAFRSRANEQASKLGIDIWKALDELSPRQFETCIPAARPVFEYLAGDLGESGLRGRLMELYCAADWSRCTGGDR